VSVTEQLTGICPACGAQASGPFCSACGARTGPRTCAACQAPLSSKARFCHRCGQPAGSPQSGPAAGRERTAWYVAGAAVTLLVALIVFKVVRDRPAVAVPDMANAGNAAPSGAPFAGDPGGGLPSGRAPDISQLSPADRFLRLNNRVMEAAARADSATVINFTPMALGAYAQLDSVTNDERYHAAVLHAQVGQLVEANALADTMLLRSPGYLLAYAVRAELAQFRGDSAALRAALAGFRAHYPAESAARRPEYADHADVIADLRQRAGL
jgi:hypothetical protein